MSDDLLITPGSRKMEFKDSSANIDAKIETDASGNLKITNAGGDIEIGDTSSDVFIGDGTNNIDIVFEQSGEIRGTSGVTLTLGASGSNVAMATDLSLGGNDLTNVGNLTMSGNLTVTGTTTTLSTATLDVEDKNITLNKGSGDTSSTANGAGITIQDAVNSSTDATILWDATNDEFDFSHPIKVAGSVGVTNIVTNKVVKFNGSVLDDSNITDTGSLITLGSATTISSGDLTIPANLKATGNNLKFFAGGTHVLNIDLNHNVYPNTHNVCDIGFSSSLAFKDAYFSGQVNTGSVVASGSLALDPDTGNNVTIAVDGTYGVSGSGRYVTLGLGGTSNGSNRIFAHNTGADGLYLAAATGRGVAIRTNGSGSNTYFFGSGGEMQRNGGNIISSTGTFIGTTGFSSDTSQTGRMYSWKPVTNTSSSGTVYIKIATLSISQSARFSIELTGRSTSYGDGNFPSWGKLVGQLNNDNNVDCVFYDFKSGQNSDNSTVVDAIFTKYISNTSHEVWVRVVDFSELGAFAYVSTGSITPHTANTGSTTSQPSGLTTITKLEMWNSNNDGASSGLDADKLDGQHGSYYAVASALNASNISSGTINTARLPNPIHLSGNNAILKLQETDVTNSPTWWHVADGGNYSIRLNNTGSYPISIQTDSDNDAVTEIDLNYTVHLNSQKLQFGGESTSYIQNVNKQGTDVWRFQTEDGLIEIGSENSSWAHFGTDRNSFYFNPKITVDGNVEPYTDSTRSLGTSSLRWANVYADTLYGDGSNITGITSSQVTTALGYTPYQESTALSATTISSGDITISDGSPLFKLYDNSNAGGGAAEGKILFSNTGGDALGIGYTSNVQTNSDFLISSDSGGTFGGHLGLDSAGISDARSHIILEPKTNLMLANGGTNTGAVFQIGLPGNGTNTNGCFFSIEGNTDGSGEGTGRIFFREHNSSTASADNYGMSLGYRGGSTSITTAMGNSNSTSALVGNGQWYMVGHDGDNQGALIMYGDRAGTFVNFDSNDIRNVENVEVADKVYHEGDTDTYMQFSAANVWRVVTNGSQAFKATATTLEVQRGLIAESDLQVGTTSTGRDVQIFMDGGAVTTDNSGLTFTMAGTYSDGRYEHRFRKRDEGGGIPLYIDKTSATANDHTQIARFGSYTSNSDEFEVYGTMSSDGYRINNTAVIDSSRNLTNIGTVSSGAITCTGLNSTSGTVQFADGGSSFDSSDASGYARFSQSGGSAQIGMARTGSSAGVGYIGADSAFLLNVYNSSFSKKASVSTNGTINGVSGYQVNGTTVIDSSRNISNVGNITSTGTVDIRDSNGTAAYYLHLPRGGGITFYGDTSQHHGIFSRNQANSAADDLLISSYGAVYIDLDSNDNNTSGSDFFIGRHNQSSGSQSALFAVRSETGNILQNGLTTMSQSSGTLTIGDIDGNDDISTVELKTMGGNGRLVIGDAEIFMYGNQNSNAEFKFTSNGILHCDNDVIAFSSTISSDKKLKENIQPIEGGLNKILKLKGVSFDWKDEKKGNNQLGFIAQDVEEVLPELVKEVETLGTEDESHKVVNYDGVIPVLVEAIKMQQKQIDRLSKLLEKK